MSYIRKQIPRFVIVPLTVSLLVATGDRSAIGDTSVSTAAEVVSLAHTEIVEPDGTFEVTVETTESAGTTVAFDPDGFDTELSSDEAVEIEDTVVRFLDPSAGDSTYTIDVNVIGGSDGDVGEIAAWVNAEQRADADDEVTSTFELGTESTDESTDDNESNDTTDGASNDTAVDDEGAGFGVGETLAALGGGYYLLKRRLAGEDNES